MLELTVNGETMQLDGPTRLVDALLIWGYDRPYFALAVNGEFVPRSQYGRVQLSGGEQLEILTPRQGG